MHPLLSIREVMHPLLSIREVTIFGGMYLYPKLTDVAQGVHYVSKKSNYLLESLGNFNRV